MAPTESAGGSGRRAGPAVTHPLATPLQFLKGIGPQRGKLLANLGLQTVEDALYYLPIRHEDRSQLTPIRRLKPNDVTKVVKRQGQESFNYGDLFAFTKVCSHLGCPASLYEQQTYRILCPCHQSQFDLLHFARPIFGPAARALAQLPITINKDGYLVANGNFIEPVGPAFWERKTT